MLEYLPITQSLCIYISSLLPIYVQYRSLPSLSLSPINEGVARIVVRRLTECRACERVMCGATRLSNERNQTRGKETATRRKYTTISQQTSSTSLYTLLIAGYSSLFTNRKRRVSQTLRIFSCTQ